MKISVCLNFFTNFTKTSLWTSTRHSSGTCEKFNNFTTKMHKLHQLSGSSWNVVYWVYTVFENYQENIFWCFITAYNIWAHIILPVINAEGGWTLTQLVHMTYIITIEGLETLLPIKQTQCINSSLGKRKCHRTTSAFWDWPLRRNRQNSEQLVWNATKPLRTYFIGQQLLNSLIEINQRIK